MSWDYNDSLTSTRDWVRFRVGDTDNGNQLLSNEEIDAILSEEGNKYKAAIIIAKALAGKFSGRVDKTVGRLRIAAQQKYEHYIALAKTLESEMARRVSGYAGGISESDIRTVEQDTDRKAPAFNVGMFDTESTGEDPEELADSFG